MDNPPRCSKYYVLHLFHLLYWQLTDNGHALTAFEHRSIGS